MLKSTTTLPGLVMETADRLVRRNDSDKTRVVSNGGGALPSDAGTPPPAIASQDPTIAALDAHLEDTENPHEVTAAQAGAVANDGGAPSLLEGAASSRPAAGTIGRLFVDIDGNGIWRDTGTDWVQLAGTGLIIPGDAGQVLFNSDGSLGAAAQLYYAAPDGVANLGLGTDTPGDGVFTGAIAGRLIHVKYTTERASVVIDGNGRADVVLKDQAAAADARIVVLRSRSGKFTIGPHNDAGSVIIRAITVDQLTGKIAILHTATLPNPTSALDVNGDVEIGLANFYYLGDPTTDGSFRIAVDSGVLYSQKRESGAWVSKATLDSVTQIQGRAVASTAPASGQVLKWNGSAWAPADDLQSTGTGVSWPGICSTNPNSFLAPSGGYALCTYTADDYVNSPCYRDVSSRIYPTIAGIYQISVSVYADRACTFYTQIEKNGTTMIHSSSIYHAAASDKVTTITTKLAATDYIRILVGNSISGTNASNVRVTVQKISD